MAWDKQVKSTSILPREGQLPGSLAWIYTLNLAQLYIPLVYLPIYLAYCPRLYAIVCMSNPT
jgi:hypothetical protein